MRTGFPTAAPEQVGQRAAGMMIRLDRPCDVGDLVEISGVFGRVEHMSLVSTSVLTLDNRKLVVANSRIRGDVIENVTDQGIRRARHSGGPLDTFDAPVTEAHDPDPVAGNDG